jgi:Tfp pilus assembly protein PilW
MTHALRNERGLTLMELTVVFVLATLVMTGLVSFYLNSQATWVDGSTQAQAQREETLIVQSLADSIHTADKATVTNYPSGDPQHQMVTLFRNNNPFYAFWWSPTDSSIHGGLGPGISDKGPLMTSRVTIFQLQSSGDTLIVLSLLEAHNAGSDLTRIGSSFAAYNR